MQNELTPAPVSDAEALTRILNDFTLRRRNRILVCLHTTHAKNLVKEFIGLAVAKGIRIERVNDTTVELRAAEQWQRMYFATMYQDPRVYDVRVAEVHLTLAVQTSLMGNGWSQYARKNNAALWGEGK